MTSWYTGAESFGSAYFGEGCGSIVLDDLNCEGNEPHPQKCGLVEGQNHRDCVHHKDAGVRCVLTGERMGQSSLATPHKIN